MLWLLLLLSHLFLFLLFCSFFRGFLKSETKKRHFLCVVLPVADCLRVAARKAGLCNGNRWIMICRHDTEHLYTPVGGDTSAHSEAHGMHPPMGPYIAAQKSKLDISVVCYFKEVMEKRAVLPSNR